jgi:3-deoxy-manno-octulosonate cytidylyltransferase (CMP-KDO synthetase)
MEKKKVVCVIPARYGSTRLPGKPLLEVKGLPLIMWAYNQAVKAGVFDTVIVATDDQRIQHSVEAHGGQSVLTSRNHKTGTDRVREAIANIDCEYVVNIQGDEPDIPVHILRDFRKNLTRLNEESLLTCVSNATIEDMENPNVVKVVLAANGEALYFSRCAIPYHRDTRRKYGYRHAGIYGFTRGGIAKFCGLRQGALEQVEMLEQLRALEAGMKIICLVRTYTSTGIDTLDDLEAFRHRMGDNATAKRGITS